VSIDRPTYVKCRLIRKHDIFQEVLIFFNARDLTPCDFLWGYLKSLVYVDRPRTIDYLKSNIRDAIANIPIDMLRRVDENFKKRLNQCVRDGGRHLTDVIFKTK